jgi:hypothetical protein
VQEDGPAAKGGVRNGDVVLRFNNQDVREMRNLPRIVAGNARRPRGPGGGWRDGREQTVGVTVGELPAEPQQAAATPGPQPQRSTELTGLGLRVAPLSAERGSASASSPSSAAWSSSRWRRTARRRSAELRPGDVVVEVQQERVNTPQELQQRLAQLRQQNRGTVLLSSKASKASASSPCACAAAASAAARAEAAASGEALPRARQTPSCADTARFRAVLGDSGRRPEPVKKPAPRSAGRQGGGRMRETASRPSGSVVRVGTVPPALRRPG